MFHYACLPYGVSSAPTCYEKCVAEFLNAMAYFDDILLSSPTESDYLQLLDQVLYWLEKAGLRGRKEKCQFVCYLLHLYLCHKIDAEDQATSIS